jgi:hypothetical protein
MASPSLMIRKPSLTRLLLRARFSNRYSFFFPFIRKRKWAKVRCDTFLRINGNVNFHACSGDVCMGDMNHAGLYAPTG